MANHLFVAGANVFYHLEKYEEAILDCERAIQIDPNFAKAYFRQGLAQYELVNSPEAQQKALQLFERVVEMDPDNQEVVELLNFAREESKEDSYVPVPAEKVRFETLFAWMKEGGANFDNLKMRYYAPDYRGVHASRNIKKGETILYVPKDEIITLEMAQESPIGA